MNQKPTRKEAYRVGRERLKKAGIEEADLDSWYLLEKATGVDKVQYYGNPEAHLKEEEFSTYLSFLEKRESRIPLQHILEEQSFYGHHFFVNSEVLIPRWETEALVEEGKKKCRPNGQVLELCTGSGCVILSLKKEREDIRALGTDISKQALQVARKNARKLGAKVDFIESDLFQEIRERFDVILLNPPYIPTEEIFNLEPEVQRFEPHLALDGGEDGLDFYRNICKKAPDYLEDEGWLILEIGHNQGREVAGMMNQSGFSKVEIKKDLAGLDRIVLGMYNRS